MDSAVWGALGVIIGAIIAGAVSIGGELLRGRQEADLDSRKRQDDRRIGSDDLQRATLLELQERLAEWVRAEILLYSGDIASVKEAGKLTRLPEDLSNTEFEAARSLMYLTERVLDDGLRNQIVGLRAYVGERQAMLAVEGDTVTVYRLRGEQEDLIRRALTVHEGFGPVLRKYL